MGGELGWAGFESVTEGQQSRQGWKGSGAHSLSLDPWGQSHPLWGQPVVTGGAAALPRVLVLPQEMLPCLGRRKRQLPKALEGNQPREKAGMAVLTPCVTVPWPGQGEGAGDECTGLC